MTDDALKALLTADAPPPAQDIGFSVEVMKHIARRRLIDGVITLTLWVVAISAVLFLTMPYVTPAIIRLATPLLPVVGLLTAFGFIALGWEHLRPALRQYGLRI